MNELMLKLKTLPVLIGLVIAVVTIGGIVLIILQLRSGSPTTQNTNTTLKTFFAYSTDDIAKLKKNSPKKNLTANDIYIWEKKAQDIVASRNTTDLEASRFYAYLAIAHWEAAAVSKQVHKKLAGDYALISKSVICEFYKDNCNELVAEDSDKYSAALSDMLMTKIKQRMSEDSNTAKLYPLQADKKLWQSTTDREKVGIHAAGYKPWLLASVNQFRLAAPPASDSAEVKQQVALLKGKSNATLTNDEIKMLIGWSGVPGTRTVAGNWSRIVSETLKNRKMALESYLEIKTVLSLTLADAALATYDSKYVHQSKRPVMVDPTLVTLVPTPNSPGYPASSASVSSAAATVLDHYLPELKSTWQQNVSDVTFSQLQGGTQLPLDIEGGRQLGVNVAGEGMKKWKER